MEISHEVVLAIIGGAATVGEVLFRCVLAIGKLTNKVDLHDQLLDTQAKEIEAINENGCRYRVEEERQRMAKP